MPAKHCRTERCAQHKSHPSRSRGWCAVLCWTWSQQSFPTLMTAGEQKARSSISKDEGPHKFLQRASDPNSDKRIWRQTKKGTSDAATSRANMVCSTEFWASDENKWCTWRAVKTIAKTALSFCVCFLLVVVLLNLLITRLYDFFASLIKLLIDAGAL